MILTATRLTRSICGRQSNDVGDAGRSWVCRCAAEAGSEQLHGRLSVHEHRQRMVDDEFVEEWRFLVGAELDAGAAGAAVRPSGLAAVHGTSGS
jgi:hypothetical protein